MKIMGSNYSRSQPAGLRSEVKTSKNSYSIAKEGCIQALSLSEHMDTNIPKQ